MILLAEAVAISVPECIVICVVVLSMAVPASIALWKNS
jgi:hypothetical protein